MDMLQAYRDALSDTAVVVAGVRPDQLSDGTPCRSFDVRALLNHIVAGQRSFAAGAAGERTRPEDLKRDVVGDDWVGAYDQAAKAALVAFEGPDVMQRTFPLAAGDVPAPVALTIAVMETTVHGWDLAEATGQARVIGPEVAEAILTFAKGMVDGYRGEDPHAPFGPAVPVPDDASAQDRLLGFLGRRS